MAIKDYPKTVAPALRPLLREGEHVLAISSLLHEQGTTEDVSLADELKNLLDPTMLIGGAHPGQLLQRAVFGRAVVGGPDSIARRLFDTIELGYDIAITDSRLLIVEIETASRGAGFWQRWFGPVDRTARLIYEVPRNVVLGAVPAPAGVLRRGRMLVIFTDRSVCALVCSPPSLARPVLDAIGAPRPPGGGSWPDKRTPGEGRE